MKPQSKVPPPRYLPSSQEIAAQCSRLQRKWSSATRCRRAGYVPEPGPHNTRTYSVSVDHADEFVVEGVE